MTSEGVTAGGVTRASTSVHVIMYARPDGYALLLMPNLLQLKWWMRRRGVAETAGYAADPHPSLKGVTWRDRAILEFNA